MLTEAVLAIAISTVMVPPGEPVLDHSQPSHYTQPTIRFFREEPTDDLRRMQWEAYTETLDNLWRDYRASGSTPEAFEFYKRALAERRAEYIFADPYYAPVIPGLILPSAWCW